MVGLFLKVTEEEEYTRDKISFEVTGVKIREKREREREAAIFANSLNVMFIVAFQVSSFTKTFDLLALERLFDVSLQREIPDASRSFFSYLQVDLRQWIIGRCHRKKKSEQMMDIEHFLNVYCELYLRDLLTDVDAMKFCHFCKELLLLLSMYMLHWDETRLKKNILNYLTLR